MRNHTTKKVKSTASMIAALMLSGATLLHSSLASAANTASQDESTKLYIICNSNHQMCTKKRGISCDECFNKCLKDKVMPPECDARKLH